MLKRRELVKKCRSEVKEGKGRGMCDASRGKSQDWDEGQWSWRGGDTCAGKELEELGSLWRHPKDPEPRLGSSGKALGMGELLLHEILGIWAM